MFLKQTKNRQATHLSIYLRRLYRGTSMYGVRPTTLLQFTRYVSLQRPLFQFQDGTSLSRNKLVAITKRLIQELDLDLTLYSGHSFRRGGATTAATAGFAAWELIQKQIGRWNSDAYHRYIQTPLSTLTEFAASCQ